MSAAETVRVLDPSGTPRATLPLPASFRAILGVAWGLAEGDSLQIIANGPDRWALMTFRPGRVPVCVPTGVESRHFPGKDNAAVLEGMCETAWLDLTEEGWRVEKAPEGDDPA